jgi:hypothetical protein
MAKTVTDDEKRKEYILRAEEELNKICASTSVMPLENPSLDNFLDDVIVVDKNGRTPRRDIYKKYEEYCEKNGYSGYSRNFFYRFLRLNGIEEGKTCNERYFKVSILEYPNCNKEL